MTLMTFQFLRFTQIITSTLPTLISWLKPIQPSLHSNLPAAFFIYCIWAYDVLAPFTPAAFLPLACTCNSAFFAASVLFTLQTNQCLASCIHCHITFDSLHMPSLSIVWLLANDPLILMLAKIYHLLDLPGPLLQAVESVVSHCYLFKVCRMSTHVYHCNLECIGFRMGTGKPAVFKKRVAQVRVR